MKRVGLVFLSFLLLQSFAFAHSTFRSIEAVSSSENPGVINVKSNYKHIDDEGKEYSDSKNKSFKTNGKSYNIKTDENSADILIEESDAEKIDYLPSSAFEPNFDIFDDFFDSFFENPFTNTRKKPSKESFKKEKSQQETFKRPKKSEKQTRNIKEDVFVQDSDYSLPFEFKIPKIRVKKSENKKVEKSKESNYTKEQQAVADYIKKLQKEYNL